MKIAARLLVFGVALLMGAAAAFPTMVDRLSQRVESSLERTLACDLEIGDLQWTFAGQVVLKDLKVREATAPSGEKSLATVGEVRVQSAFNPMSLKVRVLSVDATDVAVHLSRRDDGSDNVRGPLIGLLKLAGLGPRDKKDGSRGGGLSRCVDRHLPEIEVTGLEVTADTAKPVAPGVPTRISLAGGRMEATNTALLKEEDNVTVKVHFDATSLSPRGGLDVDFKVPLKGKAFEGRVAFQRPVEVPIGERLLSLKSFSWNAGVLSIEGVELSRPNVKNIADAEPQIAVERVRVDVALDEVFSTVGQVLAGGEVGVRELLGALNRVVIERPTLMFERGVTGHSLSDLIPDGVPEEEDLEPQSPPLERALGHLMEATSQAIRRLAIREEEAGGGFRGFMVRGFDRLESGVAR
ncbi:MAG: hypothetical protein VX938_03020, partial [Myxococcota bacterium]|nr:hypothetical protein [Myxococcota bacterium]